MLPPLPAFFARFVKLTPVPLGAILALLALPHPAEAAPANPLLEWKTWKAYRGTVQHPALSIKSADIVRARANMASQAWAREYADELVKSNAAYLERLTPQWLEAMIPETTPQDRNFTPCPACRDLGKPLVPHGTWTWHPDWMERLRCSGCGTTFPNNKYPETVELHATWGKPQTFTFCGAPPFTIFGRTVRPSFSGNIRARKVEWMASLARNLAELYVLTGQARYAVACRQILLRFAAVYPNWLVHSGYGDYANIDPKVAALTVSNLPEDDLSYPPLVPDRRLHSNYWSAGRASGVGMEGTFVRRVVEAYDLTCTALSEERPVYSDEDRVLVERDLLLESTALLAGDRLINNKSMGNRTAAALVGICTGHPGLVRFGMEGFQQSVNSWFLPDGGTPESSAYAIMAMEGLMDLPQAMRSYSDPPNYADMYNRHYEKLNLYREPAFARAWNTLCETLQGDMVFPPLADSYRTTRIPRRFVELLTSNYPDNLNFAAIRAEYDRSAEEMIPVAVAIYTRDPQGTSDSLTGRTQTAEAAFSLKSQAFPSLGQGYLRTGADGRESLLVMNASPWGIHHHLDSLGLYYWKNGQELLSDLGYLWDHPRQGMNVRSLAHNLVLIDEKDQAGKDRGGVIDYFKVTPNVRAMGAHSQAYPQASIYARNSALVDHGKEGSYVVDFFAVQGGNRQDYVFHGPNNDWANGTLPGAANSAELAATEPLYDLTPVRKFNPDAPAIFSWNMAGGQIFQAHLFPASGQNVFLGQGWGQRDFKNSDIGATLPYVVWRSQDTGLTVFPAVYCASPKDRPLVRDVKMSRTPAGTVTLTVKTAFSDDIIQYTPPREAGKATSPEIAGAPLTPCGSLNISSGDGKSVKWKFSSAE